MCLVRWHKTHGLQPRTDQGNILGAGWFSSSQHAEDFHHLLDLHLLKQLSNSRGFWHVQIADVIIMSVKRTICFTVRPIKEIMTQM